MGAEAIAKLLQFTAQFEMIIDFAVEDDDGVAIVRYYRLISAFDIDNLEARRAQRNGFGFKNSLLVRTAVDNAGHRLLNAPGHRGAMSVRKAGNAAQSSSLPPINRPLLRRGQGGVFNRLPDSLIL